MRNMLQRLLEGARPDLNALVDAFGEAVPTLHQLKETEQDPEWHAEGDVHIHTQMVLDELYAEMSAPDFQVSRETEVELILGVLLHDLAKPFTTRRMEIRGVERVAAPRHEPKGRSLIATALIESGLPWNSLWNVMGMVGSHHEPKLLVVKDRAVGEYLRISRRVDPFLVSYLERADMRGRTCSDQATQIQLIQLYEMGAEEYSPKGWEEPWRQYFQETLPDRTDAFRDRVYGEAIRALQDGRISEPPEAGFLAYQEPAEPPELVVMCGPSGSGKSTFIADHLKDHIIVSLDSLREEITGKRADNSRDGEVMQEAKFRLKAALRPGNKVVWDATSLRYEHRSMTCQMGFDYKALVSLVVFQESPTDYATRNAKREHPIPRSALESQLNAWEFPEPDEAHRMVVVDGRGKVRGAFGLCGGKLPWGLSHAD